MTFISEFDFKCYNREKKKHISKSILRTMGDNPDIVEYLRTKLMKEL